MSWRMSDQEKCLHFSWKAPGRQAASLLPITGRPDTASGLPRILLTGIWPLPSPLLIGSERGSQSSTSSRSRTAEVFPILVDTASTVGRPSVPQNSSPPSRACPSQLYRTSPTLLPARAGVHERNSGASVPAALVPTPGVFRQCEKAKAGAASMRAKLMERAGAGLQAFRRTRTGPSRTPRTGRPPARWACLGEASIAAIHSQTDHQRLHDGPAWDSGDKRPSPPCTMRNAPVPGHGTVVVLIGETSGRGRCPGAYSVGHGHRAQRNGRGVSPGQIPSGR